MPTLNEIAEKQYQDMRGPSIAGAMLSHPVWTPEQEKMHQTHTLVNKLRLAITRLNQIADSLSYEQIDARIVSAELLAASAHARNIPGIVRELRALLRPTPKATQTTLPGVPETVASIASV